jgi:hypothetical protein
MGLDMYLFAKRFMWFNEDDLKDGVTRVFQDLPEGVRAKEVQFEVGYWRKANHIHKWFVENVQEGKDDCGYYYVSQDKVKELLASCRAVLDNRELAQKLLPTQEGFFFGGTDYDEYYYSDIEDTVKILERAEAMSSGYELEYHSSW